MEKSIIVNNVTKKYKLYNRTKERVLDLITPKSYGEDFYALADVSFEANQGDAIGFVGVNGSGKSTLSNIIAGIVPETSGSVEVDGQTSLIAVAAGLKGDLTGRDNIELKCLMLGFSKDEIRAMEPDIIEFSELGKFIDQPVKSYSSGMKSRLGFAISVNVDPDILIIDEALSVGDKAFAEKSLDQMKEFKQQGKTMIFVSHSIGQMKQFCEKILWLEYGMVREYGPVKEVIPKYEAFLNQWKRMSKVDRDQYRQKVLEHQQNVIEGNSKGRLQSWNEDHISEVSDNYTEAPTSRLAHIKPDKSDIYKVPKNLDDRTSSKGYKGNVYYIKKRARYRGETFYLLSRQPSANDGIIGWMKATDVSSHSHIAIDNDAKILYLKGKGIGYSHAWGDKKNRVYANLKSFKGVEFKVNKTDKVGKNIWYRGLLSGKQVWIHSSHLIEKPSEPMV